MSQDQETEYIRMLRQEFFKTHPDGKYNEHIKKGEVVRGMDFLEVLASWGNPDAREKPTQNLEQRSGVSASPQVNIRDKSVERSAPSAVM